MPADGRWVPSRVGSACRIRGYVGSAGGGGGASTAVGRRRAGHGCPRRGPPGDGDDDDHALHGVAPRGLDDLNGVEQGDEELEREGAADGGEHPAAAAAEHHAAQHDGGDGVELVALPTVAVHADLADEDHPGHRRGDSDDSTNARVLSHTGEEPAKRAASGLSPTASRLRPNGVRITQAASTHSTTSTITE